MYYKMNWYLLTFIPLLISESVNLDSDHEAQGESDTQDMYFHTTKTDVCLHIFLCKV